MDDPRAQEWASLRAKLTLTPNTNNRYRVGIGLYTWKKDEAEGTCEIRQKRERNKGIQDRVLKSGRLGGWWIVSGWEGFLQWVQGSSHPSQGG